MADKAIQFAFGAVMLALAFTIGKFDCFIFTIMADMLKEGLEMSTYNLTILIALASLFLIILGCIVLPATCGIYILLGVFDIDITNHDD